MARYQISVLDQHGSSKEFELYADSAGDLDQKIADQGWVVLRLRRVRDRTLKIKNEELILLCQHLRLILDAGLPVLEALNALAGESESRAM
jgi:type II secretory pathway component PulF